MSLIIFGFGVLVFLLTVFGTVVAGGISLTARQLDENRELSDLADLDPDSTATTRDVIGSEF
jgi:hypothetical protein